MEGQVNMKVIDNNFKETYTLDDADHFLYLVFETSIWKVLFLEHLPVQSVTNYTL